MAETTPALDPLQPLVVEATRGNRDALHQLLLAVKDDVARLCLRMLGHPEDAEDATQEILIRVTTNLGSFQGRSSFSTWVWRVTCNHLLNVKKSRREIFSFEMLEPLKEQTRTAEPLTTLTDAEHALLQEEVKLGCTEAMVLSLDRDHRIAFILGELFELSSEQGAEVLDIEAATFRKRLSRARERIGNFMVKHCGLVRSNNNCSCDRALSVVLPLGLVNPERLIWTAQARKSSAPKTEALKPAHATHKQELDDLIERAMQIQREHPEYCASPSLESKLRELLESSDLGVLSN